MKGEVARLKVEDPKITNQEAFKKGAANWGLKKEKIPQPQPKN